MDATCPVVLQLQRKIHKCYVATRDSHTQVVIYGKKGHAEVNGLVGQTEGTAIVIEKVEDLDRLDFNRNICLFSQTTKSLDGFREVVAEIRRRIADGVRFEYFDTICRQVANRLPNIKTFASRHDWVYFVAGKKSSNGKMLLEECRKANPEHGLYLGSEGDYRAAARRSEQCRGVRSHIHSEVADGRGGCAYSRIECQPLTFRVKI